MKYKSELIKEIVEARGHKKSSLHYESECVETWIEEAKGAYPKLCDYESEWLNYISILDDIGGGEDPEPPIGEFPYVVLSDVTEATVDNVVPYAYKSAILKGQTLVNLMQPNFKHWVKNNNEVSPVKATETEIIVDWSKGVSYNHWFTYEDRNEPVFGDMLKPNTDYTFFVDILENNPTLNGLPTSGICVEIWVWGVRGYTNYCSYISSCKTGIIKFKMNFSRTATSDVTKFGIRVLGTNSNGEKTIDGGIFRMSKNVLVLEGDYTNVDIPYFEGMQSVKMPVLTTTNEDGTKSNILTVIEEVELRGIGDVKDTLDCLTGEVVQKVSEIIIDKNTNVMKYQDVEGFNTSGYYVYFPSNFGANTTDFICNSLPNSEATKIQPNIAPVDEEGIAINGGIIKFRVSNEKGASIEDFKKYLEVNPIKLIIPLVKKSVKTVDLSCINEQGESATFRPIEGTMHLSTSSDTIKPLFTGEIPVEAIIQNLASFIDLETEE